MSLIEDPAKRGIVLRDRSGRAVMAIEGATSMNLTLFLIVLSAGFCPHVVDSAWGQLSGADQARWVLRSRFVGRDHGVVAMSRGGRA